MKQKSILLLLALLFLLVPATSVQAAEDESFTVSYGKGYYFVNPLTGAEATGIFTGKIPASVTVESGGSVTVAENTIVFRDYEFVAWEHKYTVVENGEEKTVTKRYSPGDTLENVTQNVTLQAVWKRPAELPLQIGGFLYYKKGDVNVDGDEPAPVRYTTGQPLTVADCPFRKDGHSFTAWVDGDGRVYPAGSEMTPDSVTVTLLPIWAKDNEAVATHRVTYTTDEPGLTGELPASFELYEKSTFIVAENTQSKAGFAFSHWEDRDGNRYAPRGHIHLHRQRNGAARRLGPDRRAVYAHAVLRRGRQHHARRAAERAAGRDVRIRFSARSRLRGVFGDGQRRSGGAVGQLYV